MFQENHSSLNNFFNEKISSGNVTPGNHKHFMHYEWLRFLSFMKLPANCPVFAIKLASAGLYKSEESGDKVHCFACNFSKSHWKTGDNPLEIHKTQNPDCPFISGVETNTSTHLTNIPILVPLDEVIPERFSRIRNLLEPFILPESGYPEGEEMQEEIAEATGNREGVSLSTPSSPVIPNESEFESSQPSTQRTSISRTANTGDQSQVFRRISGGPVPRVSADERLGIARTGQVIVAEGIMADQATPGPSSPTSNRVTSMAKDPGLLKFERNRLETFKGWPSGAPVAPRDLARSGFYYVGVGDRVQCVFCRGILKDWDPGDKPHIEHKNKFPKCSFILGVAENVPFSPNVPERALNIAVNQGSRSQMEALGISTSRPKYPNYAVEATRYSSFISWPPYKHQTPNALAKAGFFYAGFGDNVKCFYCDGGLKNWEPGDDPWVEHARWFPRCPFLKNVKGEQFIQGIQDTFTSGSVKWAGQGLHGSVHRIEEREIKARLALPMVRAVLETGLSKEVVMHAIKKRLEVTGDDFPNAEALMNAALELNDDPASLNATVTEPSTSSDPQEPSTSESSKKGSEEPKKGSEDESKKEETTKSGDLSEEVRQLKEQKTCKICLDNEVGMVFLPCGHLCCCVECAPAVQLCPICRSAIRGMVRTYIP